MSISISISVSISISISIYYPHIIPLTSPHLLLTSWFKRVDRGSGVRRRFRSCRTGAMKARRRSPRIPRTPRRKAPGEHSAADVGIFDVITYIYIYLSIYRSIHPSIYLSIYYIYIIYILYLYYIYIISIYLSVYLRSR